MKNEKKLLDAIDTFYSEIVEEYKEITMAIRGEATPLAIFKKKNYQLHIDRLKELKKRLLALDPSRIEIDANDKFHTELKNRFGKAVYMFANLCDLQVSVQFALKQTAEKKGGKYSECSEATKKLNNYNKEVQLCLHELDVMYADALQ